MKELISAAEATEIIRSYATPTSTELVPLEDALGRTLAESVVADIDVPPFDNSAMDGYAVRLGDVEAVPADVPVSQEIQAGHQPEQPLAPGTCARIMTGAPIPAGTDAVVPVEWTEGTDPVRILRVPPPAHAIRRSGEDLRVGQTVLHVGRLITPPIVGMLASVGCAQVPVRIRPACAVITTGNELVSHTETPEGGQIRNSNGPALVAQVHSSGGALSRVLTARDSVSSLQSALEQSLSDDILVLSGGVSVGTYDYVKDVLQDIGVDLLFWKVLQRPGKPLLFGVR
ncbi:MAG: molybdopterin molybdotransferase MoeA, partial [Rhodothermales bacterium]|nr:molybdopterin molybdotransferase MoeA [Rhodothermales bacterium]